MFPTTAVPSILLYSVFLQVTIALMYYSSTSAAVHLCMQLPCICRLRHTSHIIVPAIAPLNYDAMHDYNSFEAALDLHATFCNPGVVCSFPCNKSQGLTHKASVISTFGKVRAPRTNLDSPLLETPHNLLRSSSYNPSTLHHPTCTY